MMQDQQHRNYARYLAALIFVSFMLLLCFLLSQLYAYYNSGASKEEIYHSDLKYFENARPYITWLDQDKMIEGNLNEYQKKEIEQAYYHSLRTLNLSNSVSKPIALEKHFTKELASRIENQLGSKELVVEQVNLSHQLQLNFLSLDNSVVSFSDIGSEVKTLVNGEMHNNKYCYEVNMVKLDGRWKIDALESVFCDKKETIKNASKKNHDLTDLRGINYYPQKTPWHLFWQDYDSKTIEADLRLVKSLDFNLVRIFIPFEIFGGANPNHEMLNKLDHFVNSADKHGVKLILTLFDFPVGYQLDKYPQYDRHLEVIIKRYESSQTVVLWDLKNEPDIDFEYQGKTETLNWLKFIIDRAKSYTNKPLTIGWASYHNAQNLADSIDIVSFHYYENQDAFENVLKGLKKRINKPLMLSEYGLSTYQGIWPGGNSENDQLLYYQSVEKTLKKQKVIGLSWCLYDYPKAPKNVFGWKPWIRAYQKNYGLIKVDGSYKAYLQSEEE